MLNSIFTTAMIQPTLSSTSAYFHSDYLTARQAWLDKVSRCENVWDRWLGTSVKSGSVPHPLTGPSTEALGSDWLWLGDPDANTVGIFFSATHGIEGYVGSAVQVFCLDFLLSRLAKPNQDVALLFIHALNPWGMAYKRRCDEQGIDLNRNYVDFTAPPTNTGYPLVQAALAIADRSQRQAALQALAESLGKTDYEIALSGGQYSDPTGPFYGGKSQAHGQRVCRTMLSDFALAGKQLVIIDIHSGLGSWGHGELISDHPLDDAHDRFARRLFGNGVTNPARGDSSSVAKYGLQDYFWHQQMAEKGCYLTLEYGSYSTDALFDVLVNDHRVWRPNANNAAIETQQQAMMQHFCPEDMYWRQSVLFQAAQVMDRLLTGLNQGL